MQKGFDARKFLELAGILLTDSNYEREPRARTAMGRIYYAAFLVAFQKLSEKGIAIQDDDKIHRAVIETYNDRGLSAIGNILDQIREMRVKADYKMMENVTVDNCKPYVKLSERVIGLVEQIGEIH